MDKLPFLKELTEARLFTDAKTVTGKSVEDIASIVYLMIMMLEITRHTNHSFAADYANRTMAYSTYENMHYAGTDLGNLLAVLNNQDTFKGYVTAAKGIAIPLFQINRYLQSCKGSTFSHNEDAQFFYRLEDYLKLYSKANFRQLRRDIGDWKNLTHVEKTRIVLILRQEFDKRASSCDIYVWFKQQFKLQESVNHSNLGGIDLDYYLTEGCGIFALALAEYNPDSRIYIFSNNHGERWSDRIPYEVTHVVTAIKGEIYDVTGKTSKLQVDQKFNLFSNYCIKGPFTPSEFAKKFVGTSDTKPLFGTKSDITAAKQIIKSNAKKYGVVLPESVIVELAPATIDTKLGYHKQLNPALWDDDDLIPEVKDALAKIANKFSEFIDVKQMKIVDYIITGSNCAFNYTDDSDIDIHVLIDASKLGENPLTSPFLLAKKALWNSGHNITVKGYDVELYAEDVNDKENKLVATGVFSLLQNKWIKKPEYVAVQYNDVSVQSKAADIMNQIDELISTGEPDQAQIDKLWNHIYKMRRSGLANGGEFDVSNLAFKVIRNNDYLNKLRDFERMREDQDLTLENRII